MSESSALPSRRAVLQAGALTGAALTLAPMTFASAAPEQASTRTIRGHLATGAADFVYLPVEVPRGVNRIAVSYTYDKPAVAPGVLGNACDIGMFDQHGTALGGRGFRGWSGGARTSFSIDAGQATPGYLPGPVGAGTWHVVLGPYQVAPQGLDYEVTVTLTHGRDPEPFVPHYPPQRVPARGRAWYRGDCHLHTVYSDGKRQPSEVAAGARQAGLDFMVTTDHNTSSSHAVWGPLAGDDLLIVTGEEVTTRNGHYLALGLPPGEWIDWRYRSRDHQFGRFAREIRRTGGIVVPAHPYGTSLASRWKFGYDDADAIEVWNGPWSVDDESSVDTWDGLLVAAVRSGRRPLPAMGNSDAHSVPQVIGLPQTVVQAGALSRDALLEGIAAGRSWIAESAEVALDFSLRSGSRTAGIGDTLTLAQDAPVTCTAHASGVPNGIVRFITDEGPVKQTTLDASGSGTATWPTTASLAAYVRVEVRHPADPATATALALPNGAMAALSNPIYLRQR